MLDEKLKKLQSTTIHLKEDPDLFSFEDILFTKENKFLILGKEFEYLNGSTKRKNKVFKTFTLKRYGAKGNLEANYKLDADNSRYSIGGKLITLPNNDIIFTGFYSNIAKGKKRALNGIYTAHIDVNGNTLTQNSSIEVTKDMLTDLTDSTGDDEDAADEKGKKKRNDDGDEGFSSSFQIRNIIVNPFDNSLVVIAEAYDFSYNTYYSPPMGSSPGYFYTKYSFKNTELLLINLSQNGRLNKISMIPKKQAEYFTERNSGGFFRLYLGGYFTQGGTYPFYSSIASLVYNNKLFIFFNDDERNRDGAVSGAATRKTKWTQNFRESGLFAYAINLSDFSVKKEDIFDNGGDVITMPRFGYVTGNVIYLPASKPKMLGKTDLRLGKIVVQ